MNVCVKIHNIINKIMYNYINIYYILILILYLILTAHLWLVSKCAFPSGSQNDVSYIFLYFSCVLYASSISSVNYIKVFQEW
jgi:hypothetical protein